jgi:hypothetical protein
MSITKQYDLAVTELLFKYQTMCFFDGELNYEQLHMESIKKSKTKYRRIAEVWRFPGERYYFTNVN